MEFANNFNSNYVDSGIVLYIFEQTVKILKNKKQNENPQDYEGILDLGEYT